jgi:hypothetical protein
MRNGRRTVRQRQPTAASYGFLGMGRSAVNTANVRAVKKNWSYGSGTLVPLSSAADLFAEWRWRTSKLVLPTARPKPPRSKELRFGIPSILLLVSEALVPRWTMLHIASSRAIGNPQTVLHPQTARECDCGALLEAGL